MNYMYYLSVEISHLEFFVNIECNVQIVNGQYFEEA